MTETLYCPHRAMACGRDPELSCLSPPRLDPQPECSGGLPAVRLGASATPQSSDDEAERPTITDGLLKGLKVLAALFTAASALSWVLIRVGIHFSFNRVGFTADDLGGREDLVTRSTSAGLAAAVAVVMIGTATTIALKVTRANRRVEDHIYPTMTGHAASWWLTALTGIGATMAAVEALESRTIGLTAQQPDSLASQVFLVGFIVAGLSCATLLLFCLTCLIRPRCFTATAEQLAVLTAYARAHVAGMFATTCVVITLAAGAMTLLTSAAVTVQLRAGHSPGVLGSWLGADVQCVLLQRPAQLQTYALLVGETATHQLYLQDGHNVLRLQDKEVLSHDPAPREACWVHG